MVVAGITVSLRGAALLLEELLVTDSGKGGGLVNNGSSINPLVNRDDLVNGGRGNGLSLDDGLDCNH